VACTRTGSGAKKSADERATLLKEARVKAMAEVAAAKRTRGEGIGGSAAGTQSSVGQLHGDRAQGAAGVAATGGPTREAR